MKRLISVMLAALAALSMLALAACGKNDDDMLNNITDAITTTAPITNEEQTTDGLFADDTNVSDTTGSAANDSESKKDDNDESKKESEKESKEESTKENKADTTSKKAQWKNSTEWWISKKCTRTHMELGLPY